MDGGDASLLGRLGLMAGIKPLRSSDGLRGDCMVRVSGHIFSPYLLICNYTICYYEKISLYLFIIT